MLSARELIAALQTVDPLTPVQLEVAGPGSTGLRVPLTAIVYTTRHSCTLSIDQDHVDQLAGPDVP